MTNGLSIDVLRDQLRSCSPDATLSTLEAEDALAILDCLIEIRDSQKELGEIIRAILQIRKRQDQQMDMICSELVKLRETDAGEQNTEKNITPTCGSTESAKADKPHILTFEERERLYWTGSTESGKADG